MPKWFETMDDGFWLHPDDVGEEEARFVRKALRLRVGDRVLDAPCGAGRIALHLAEAGCVVTGIDLRGSFIRRARRRFRAAGLSGTFRVLDLRKLDGESEFDGILNWAGSFGYFSDTENIQLVAAFARALRPGGRLIIEQPDREHLLRNFGRKVVIKHPIENDRDWVFLNTWDRRRQRVITQRTGVGIDPRRGASEMRLYTLGQMQTLFERNGLAVEGWQKSVRFDAYGPKFPRTVMVGRKPVRS